MSLVTASAFLKALGGALLNSVWQFGVCLLLYGLLTRNIKKNAPLIKHTIALCVLAVGTLTFGIGFFLKYFDISAETVSVITVPVENAAWYNGWHTAGLFADAVMPYWSLLYLACVIFLFIKLCVFVQRAGNLRHKGTAKMSAAWRVYVQNVSARLGVQRHVKALLSLRVDTPQVIGFFKPVILIPAACFNNLSTDQLEAVLLHELVHIKRHDYLVNLFVASIEIIFFFNPFVKKLTASIRQEREYSCDDMVIQFQYQPLNYAAALLILEKNRLMPVTYGIAASGKNQKQLLTRIERIVGVKNKQTSSYQAGTGLLALLLLFFIAAMHPAKKDTGKSKTALPGFSVQQSQALLYNGSGIRQALTGIAATIPKNSNAVASRKAYVLPDKTAEKDDTGEEMAGLSFTGESEEAGNRFMNIASTEIRDFSLPDNKADLVPLSSEPAPGLSAEPYVPASSFSYQFMQDTLVKKIKGETYPERKARETSVKAQKALLAINWKKIQKDLKSSPVALAKLKKEITIQLQGLDWQKINLDVQDDLNQEQQKKLQEGLKKEQLIKQYEANEAYNELMQKQIAEQEQVIKAVDLKMQKTQKALELQQKKLQQEMKVRRIISI